MALSQLPLVNWKLLAISACRGELTICCTVPWFQISVVLVPPEQLTARA